MINGNFKSTSYLIDFKDNFFYLDEADFQAFMINDNDVAVHQADYGELLKSMIDDMDIDEQENLLKHLGFRNTKIDDWE